MVRRAAIVVWFVHVSWDFEENCKQHNTDSCKNGLLNGSQNWNPEKFQPN